MESRRWSAIFDRAGAFAIALVLLSACGDNSTTTEGAHATTSSSISDAVELPCSEGAMAESPPEFVLFVGVDEVTVPFDSWECLGFNADSFSAPEDFEVFLNDGGVDVVFEVGDVTATGIVARVVVRTKLSSSLKT